MPTLYLSALGQAAVAGLSIEATFEVTKISGASGLQSPYMKIPISFEHGAQLPPDSISVGYGSMSKLFLGNTPLADCGKLEGMLSRTVEIGGFSLQGRFDDVLVLPIPAHLLEYAEDFRNGQDLALTLYLEKGIIKIAKSAKVGILPDVGLLSDVGLLRGLVSFQIPRSHWIDKVLPAMGYLSKYLIEISVPSSNALSGAFKDAVAGLEDAERQFRNDNYNGVLTFCRNAIDAIASAFKLDLNGEKAQYKTRVKAFREQYLKPRIGSTKAGLVADELLALWGPLSAPTKPGSFTADRAAAKHVLVATANLLTYLGKIFAD